MGLDMDLRARAFASEFYCADHHPSSQRSLIISNQGHLRREMAIMLRTFAAAIPQAFG